MGSVAVLSDGGWYRNAVGYSNVESNVLADTLTQYRIGSITKTFTTVLLMQEVEKGTIDLQSTIQGYFPELVNAEKITIEHLVGHRSGIHNLTDDESYFTYYTDPHTLDEMVQIIVDAGSDFEPGSKSEYSNSNFILLTYILEEETEASYETLVNERIIEPLGLDRTEYGQPIHLEDNEARSYSYMGVWKQELETDLSVPVGAGSITSTPTDIIKFAKGLFEGRLVSAESLEYMKTEVDGYGRGLFEFAYNDEVGYGHTGGIDGFSSVFTVFEESGIYFAMVSNGANYNTNNMSIVVIRAAKGIDFELPGFSTFEVSEEQLQAYVGNYVSADMPLQIKISVQNNTLIAQATGQPSFPLTSVSEHVFSFEQAGVKLIFDPEKDKMVLQQGGEYVFTRE